MHEKKKKYSEAEKRAYYLGVGAGMGRYRKVGLILSNIPASLQESFKNGLDRGLTAPTKPVFNKKKKRR